MQIIDFAKLNYQRLYVTMADMGMADFNNLPFPTILERLDLSSDRVTEEWFFATTTRWQNRSLRKDSGA